MMGKKIKELRMLANMSQEELGRRVGVQRAAIQKYEKGTVENVPLTTIEKIASVFDVSPSYIVGWSNTQEDLLSLEIRILQGIKNFYGIDAVNLLELYTELTPQGRKRVHQYIEEMAQVYNK